jgi:hypothetical protein
MNEKLILPTFLTLFILLITCICSIGCAGASTVTINPTPNPQVTINSAINVVAYKATSTDKGVVILGPGTYRLTGPIVLKSNVILKGSGDGTIIYGSSGVCNSESAPGYIYGNGISNSEICNLQFKSAATKTSDGGHGEYRNCIRIYKCSNLKIHDILVTPYQYNDGVKISKSSGIKVYNCRIRSGHDGIEFLSRTSNSRAYNNDIDIRINTGIRVDNCKNIELDHNTFYGLHGSGWCCTEMESSLSGINIHNNIFHDYKGSSGSYAVSKVHASGSVSFHDNVLWNVGSVAMGSGNNIRNPSDRSVSNWNKKGYGCRL